MHQVEGVINQLCEDSLWALLTVVQKRARRGALRSQAGDDPGDLQALRTLQAALEAAHKDKLLLR